MSVYQSISESGFIIGHFDPHDDQAQVADGMIDYTTDISFAKAIEWDKILNNVSDKNTLGGVLAEKFNKPSNKPKESRGLTNYRRSREERLKRAEIRRRTQLPPGARVMEMLPASRTGRAALAAVPVAALAYTNRDRIAGATKAKVDAASDIRRNRPASLYYDDALGKSAEFRQAAQDILSKDLDPDDDSKPGRKGPVGSVGMGRGPKPPAKKAATPRKRAPAKKAAAAPPAPAAAAPAAKKAAAKKTAAPAAAARATAGNVGVTAVRSAQAAAGSVHTPSTPAAPKTPPTPAPGPATASGGSATPPTTPPPPKSPSYPFPGGVPGPKPSKAWVNPSPTGPKPKPYTGPISRREAIAMYRTRRMDEKAERLSGVTEARNKLNAAATDLHNARWGSGTPGARKVASAEKLINAGGKNAAGVIALGGAAAGGVKLLHNKIAQRKAAKQALISAANKKRLTEGQQIALFAGVPTAVVGASELSRRRRVAAANRPDYAGVTKSMLDDIEIEKGPLNALKKLRPDPSKGPVADRIAAANAKLADFSGEATRTSRNLRATAGDINAIFRGEYTPKKKGLAAGLSTGQKVALGGAVGGGLLIGRNIAGPKPYPYQQQHQ